MRNRTTVQELYRKWAPFYDKYIDRLYAFQRRRVIELLQPAAGERILEVGIGTGLNLPYYPAETTVVGIDVSSDMLSRALKRKADVRALQMDAERTAFRSNVFDKALATYVLRAVPDPRAALRELSRILKPGAAFVVLDQFSRKAWFSEVVEPLRKRIGSGKDYPLSQLLRGTPWQIVSKRLYGRVPNTLLLVLENAKLRSF